MNKRKFNIGWDIMRTILSVKFGRRIPLYCEWEITNHCNMSCLFCSTCVENRNSTLDITIEDVKKRIDELYLVGTKIIHFSGGEPTLRKDFAQIVDYAKEKNMMVAFTTNGSSSNSTMANLLNADMIRVSIDGVGQLHDRLRNSPGAYAKAIKSIEYLRSKGRRVLISAVYSNQTSIDDMERLLMVAADLGVRVMIIPVVLCINRVDNSLVGCEYSPTIDRYIALVNHLKKNFRKTFANTGYYMKVVQGGLGSYGCRSWIFQFQSRQTGILVCHVMDCKSYKKRDRLAIYTTVRKHAP